jgi:murein DD-endopeptidase MepM/ murein hydrolase activator NlpD
MGPIRDARQGAQALESILLKQLLQESHVLQGSGQAGSGIYAEMFCEALANAVVQGGGMGIANLVEGSFAGLADQATGTEPNQAGNYLFQSSGTPSAAAPRPAGAPSDKAPEISSGFGPRRDPIDGGSKFHTGIDVAAEEGSAILAVAGGIVRRAGPRGGYGNAVEIDNGRGISTLYAHAQRLNVAVGDRVAPGDAIAAVGHTGRATGPHLHFEVREDGKPKDPQATLNRLGERADAMIGRKPQTDGNGDEP